MRSDRNREKSTEHLRKKVRGTHCQSQRWLHENPWSYPPSTCGTSQYLLHPWMWTDNSWTCSCICFGQGLAYFHPHVQISTWNDSVVHWGWWFFYIYMMKVRSLWKKHRYKLCYPAPSRPSIVTNMRRACDNLLYVYLCALNVLYITFYTHLINKNILFSIIKLTIRCVY